MMDNLTSTSDFARITLMFMIILHAYYVRQQAANSDPRNASLLAFVAVWFSSLPFVGPVAYLLLYRSRRQLAQACIRQCAVVAVLALILVALD